ncbi:MAG: HAMP domain-containing protein [Candidatus Krumholzibacteriota bacterium]|nr:HAMP domain-containing protein [Candidatus Krumholzibacteriota bacterium]
MSLRYRLAAMCLIMALLPAIPLALLVNNLLQKSFDIGLNETVSGALESAVVVTRGRLKQFQLGFEKEAGAVLSPLSTLRADSTRLASLLSDRAAFGSIEGFILSPQGGGPAPEDPAFREIPPPLRGFLSHPSFVDKINNRSVIKRVPLANGSPGLTFYETEDRALQLALWAPPPTTFPQRLLLYGPIDPEFLIHARNLLSGRQLFAQLRLEQEILGKSFFYPFIIIYGIILLLSLSLAFFMAERLGAPIRDLVWATNAVAEGDWQLHLKRKTGGEIGRLIAGFNQMVGRLDAQRHRLIDMEKMASWREMARHLAHEIKNPILPIRLTVQEMKDQYTGENPDYRELLSESVRIVDDELNHLQKLVREFSSFAKMPGLSLSAGDINKLVRDVSKLYPQAEITVHAGAQPLEAVFDPDQIRRVLVNLFDNSLSVVPGGRKAAIDIALAEREDRVTINFSDNGPGIPLSSVSRIFDPYYTTRRGGTGLGLALVKNIMLLHGGSIEVESKVDEGATFIISLPRNGPEWNKQPDSRYPAATCSGEHDLAYNKHEINDFNT